jgi:glycosyltransferase involved in cell wall biosynthesis
MLNNKIAFVIDGLQMGGAEKFFINNVNNFYKNGYHPIVFILSDKVTLIDELEKEIKVITFTRSTRYDFSITKRIRKVIKAEGIRKVFCINAYVFFLTKLAFVFERDTKFYLSLHSTIPLSFKKYLQSFLYLQLVSKYDRVIYVCNNQKSYLKKKYHFSPKYGTVIYNGIDTSYFNPALFKNLNIRDLRAAYHISNTDKVIIIVARLYPLKGHFDAIEALSILYKKYNLKANLLIVGGGDLDYTQSLKDYSKKIAMEEYVHFTGNQSDVRKFYCLSDIFTLTSHTETFSLAALEAMAFGLPCSLTDIGGANEMIIEGKNGFLSKPKSPLSIAESWGKLLNLNLKGDSIRNLTIEKFSLERMLESYMEIMR